MYTAQQVGDYFPSDDYDGDTDDRLGWMNDYPAPLYPQYLHTEDGNLVSQGIPGIDDNWWYKAGTGWVFSDYDGDFTTIGRTNLAYAIRAEAGFFKVFRDTFDGVRRSRPRP